MEENKEFKTPIYQRKAYKAYIDRNKDNEEFKEKLRKQQREYYHRNRDKILAKKKIKNDAKKKEKESEESI
jgi:hypothetical protein